MNQVGNDGNARAATKLADVPTLHWMHLELHLDAIGSVDTLRTAEVTTNGSLRRTVSEHHNFDLDHGRSVGGSRLMTVRVGLRHGIAVAVRIWRLSLAGDRQIGGTEPHSKIDAQYPRSDECELIRGLRLATGVTAVCIRCGDVSQSPPWPSQVATGDVAISIAKGDRRAGEVPKNYLTVPHCKCPETLPAVGRPQGEREQQSHPSCPPPSRENDHAGEHKNCEWRAAPCGAPRRHATTALSP
ncbi:MAG: hypothetical protein WCJ30_20095 [Deltaproteobacteria bacterium]